ncbi:hypothetical protein SAFG77S_12176 [Streptomyces afghaniensis]|uniref:hypothetical protein n=1 Tax=Streptomyces afghaniensis TaxID=66865 RepID=UPI000564FAEF|nr:hypothetical protein [Streptomyces afghaniensis]
MSVGVVVFVLVVDFLVALLIGTAAGIVASYDPSKGVPEQIFGAAKAFGASATLLVFVQGMIGAATGFIDPV